MDILQQQRQVSFKCFFLLNQLQSLSCNENLEIF